jgi:integrase
VGSEELTNSLDAEVERLIEAAKGNRYGHRDATMILMAYRHGLRVSELVDLRWDQIDFDTASLAARVVTNDARAAHGQGSSKSDLLSSKAQASQKGKSGIGFGSPISTTIVYHPSKHCKNRSA